MRPFKLPQVYTLYIIIVAMVAAGCSEQKDRLLTIAFSNDMVGEIRSCGCASKDYGGLGRRATFLTVERNSAGDFLLLDGGDLFGTNINYGREKAELTLRALSHMKYDGIVLGEKDFGLGADFIIDEARHFKLPVLAVNLFDARTDSLIFPGSRIVELESGLKVGLIGAMSHRLKLPPQVPEGTLRIENARELLSAEIASIRDKTDLIVLLAHMHLGTARTLVVNEPDVDFIVCGHEGRPARAARKFGNAHVVQVSDRGRYMGLATARLNKENKIAELFTEVEPLTKEYSDDQAIVKMFQSYDLEIANVEKKRLSTLTLEEVGKPYEGADACKTCHADVYTQWQGTKHAHAFDILTNQNRQYDRDCVPCHTTGFFKLGGFVSADQTPQFTHIQCESCHGNGYDHVRNPTVAKMEKGVTICTDCHTEDQTPDFSFAEHWDRIKH